MKRVYRFFLAIPIQRRYNLPLPIYKKRHPWRMSVGGIWGSHGALRRSTERSGEAQRKAPIAASLTSKNLASRARTSTDLFCVDSADYIVVRRDGDMYWTRSNIYTQTGSKAQGAWHYQWLGTKKDIREGCLWVEYGARTHDTRNHNPMLYLLS